MSLKETKDVLQANDAAISNVEGDVTRLHAKIKELSEQQPNDPLVGEILAIAQAQKARLDALAGQTPEEEVPPAE